MFPCVKFKNFVCPFHPSCQRGNGCLYLHPMDHRKRSYDTKELLAQTTVSSKKSKPEIEPKPIILIESQEPAACKTPSRPMFAHSSAQVVHPDQPPILRMDAHSKAPKETRQRSLNKYFLEFKRIYAPLLKSRPGLPHEHAIK